VVTGDDVELGKPDPTIYRITCRKLGLKPQDVLVFEDAASGIEAARQAGMRCIGVLGERTAPEPLLAAGTSYLISSFEECSLEAMCY
jgi:beta-phosphoglucomutase-like phosphatase (HAD superfamily)